MDVPEEKNKSIAKRKEIDGDCLEEKETIVSPPIKAKFSTFHSDPNEKIPNEEKAVEENLNDENSSEETVEQDSDDKDSSKKCSVNDEQSEKESSFEENQSDEENHFETLFHEVLKIFKETNPIDTDLVGSALRDIKNSFQSRTFNSLNFNSPEYLTAYFEHYSTLNAAVARHRFLIAITNCEKLKTVVANNSELKVISLGGGPGTDMVGFCSALQEYREEQNRLLDLCVVDMWEKWKSFYEIIIELLRKRDYGNTSIIFQKNKIHTSFMKVDLMDREPSPEYKSALRSADIVLLSRVLDSLKFKEQRPQVMLRNISQRMKKGALLLVVDTGKYYDVFLQRIYASDLDTFTVRNTKHAQVTSNAQVTVYVRKG